MAQAAHPASTGSGLAGHWPVVVGVVAGAGLGWGLWSGHVSWRQAVAVLVAAAFVYLGSAALDSRRAAWPMFGLTVVAITAGGRVALLDPVLVLGVAALLLAVVGLARGRIEPGWGLPAQSAVMVLALAVALLASGIAQPWAGLVLAAGLVGHAVWDVAHYRSRRVVAVSMAAFCAVFDVLLAGAIVAVVLTAS